MNPGGVHEEPTRNGGAERLTARTARTAVLFKLLFLQKCELKVCVFSEIEIGYCIYYRPYAPEWNM